MAKLTQKQYDQLIQKGLSEAQIKVVAQKKGYELPTKGSAAVGVAKGFVKGLIGDIARPTAQALQGLGQRAIAAVTPASLQQVQQTTGLKSLDDKTIEGQAVVQALKTPTASEKTGRVAANVAAFFIPTAPAISATGRTLQATGRVASRAGLGITSKEAILVQAYKARAPVGQRISAALTGKDLGRPITGAETALKKSLFGTESMIGVQAQRASKNIWDKVIAPALKSSKKSVDMPKFINNLGKQVDEIVDPSRKKELKLALDAFKEDFSGIGKVNLTQLQKYKEGWAKFLPQKAFKGQDVSAAFKQIQNLAAQRARKLIYKSLDSVEGKAAYFDYGNLQGLKELGQKAMTGSRLKGGAGSFVSGLYHTVITPITSVGGLTLYKTGQGLEFVGRQGTKVLGALFR